MQGIQTMPKLDVVIQRSLERSTQYGIDPHLTGASEETRLAPDLLAVRIKAQQEFYDSAVEQMDTLYRLLKGTGFCMALADAEGYVLYVTGDTDLVEHFKSRRCVPGYRWTERDMGTCAIGLALEERVPIFLPGSKMYCAPARNYSNAGAPIFSPDGCSILGALSLTGDSQKMHIHTLGLVRQAAETVTSHLRERERLHALLTTNQYLRALIESDSRGIVTVDSQGRIVQANRSARRLFGLPAVPEGLSFENFISGHSGVLEHLMAGKSFQAREILAQRSGMTHFASFDPICSSGEVVGGLLNVLEKKEAMGMAVKVTGSHAYFTFDSILGTSTRLGLALRHARIAAANATTVLLCGETGTGKELFAQAIHNGGERRSYPFVAINCGAIPKELLESELFGYEEGAFTGARKGGRPGKFELADSGTLFLDEIGDMPFDMQVKLLRVLQTGEIQRVGGLRSVSVDLRIISATNKDLRQAIEQQQFRADLYYRISTLSIEVPPLRERPEDILPLAEYFIQRHRVRLNKPTTTLPPETATMLTAYAWPGNVRQLESAVERAMHLAEGCDLLAEYFGIADLEQHQVAELSEVLGVACNVQRGRQGKQDSLEELNQRAVVEALARHRGNIRATAQALGVSRPTLYRRLQKLKNGG